MKSNKAILPFLFFLFFTILRVYPLETKKIYYDENWKVLKSSENSKYYRIIKINEYSNPIGEICDYYSTGEIYARGSAEKIDKSDDKKTKFNGSRKFYLLNGNLSTIISYNNGNITDFYTFWENGQLCKSIKYVKDTPEKVITLFNENGIKTEEIIYRDSVPKYDWYLMFDESGNSTKFNIETKTQYYKEKSKTFYKDGETYQYYSQEGIIVTLKFNIERNYGKYYVCYVGISNLTGQEFNFDPKDITATLINDNLETTSEILSSDEYMKKVSNRQNWETALVGFAQGIATIGAGYSESATIAGTTDGNNSILGVGVTKSYNKSENYMINQNAQNNMNNLKHQQFQVKNDLNKGYLKLNTIFNEERIYGQFNILFKPAKKIMITIPINGVNYDFLWDI